MPCASFSASLDPAFLDAEEARDPEPAAREYGAEFYESASMFLSADHIEACVVRDRFELPPQANLGYTAALDAGFRADSFTFSVVHGIADGKVVQDVIRAWKGNRSHPVNLSEVLSVISATLKSYGISKIFGDQFCSEPIRQALAQMGITFEQNTTLGSRAASLWNAFRTLVSQRKIELLDDDETIAELKRLELVITRAGTQRIEAASGHDDRCVSLALATFQCVSRPHREPWCETILVGGVRDESERGWQRIG